MDKLFRKMRRKSRPQRIYVEIPKPTESNLKKSIEQKLASYKKPLSNSKNTDEEITVSFL